MVLKAYECFEVSLKLDVAQKGKRHWAFSTPWKGLLNISVLPYDRETYGYGLKYLYIFLTRGLLMILCVI